uniref:Uncharacterized protein n=1 Tax=Panagrolaimus davidi TaxID=227884 RepID=A0A914P688_9BILA
MGVKLSGQSESVKKNQDYDKKDKQLLLNTSSSNLPCNTLSIIDEVKTKRNWKKENTNANNSILSLYNADDKNLIEIAVFDLVDDKNVALKWNKTDSNNFHRFFVQNPFEFPRQAEKNHAIKTEVMQFKASQRLLRYDQSTSSKTIRIPTTASFPARMPVSSNHNANYDLMKHVRMPNFFVPHNLGLFQGHRQQQLRGLHSVENFYKKRKE